MDKKKLIIVSIGIVIVVGLSLFVFLGGSPKDEGQTTTESSGFLSFLFPSSQDKPGEPFAEPSNQQDTGDLTTGEYSTPGKLTQLTTRAIAGAVFSEEALKVQYFEKATGHMYEIDAFGQNKEQRTITTIPKILEVSWSKDASKAILRYLAEPEEESSILEPVYTFIATSLTSTTTEGVFLPLNTILAVASPEEDKVFYLLEGDTSAGIVSSFENQNKKEVFYSPFSEFLADWPTKNTITLLTKPSAMVEGYFYRINPQTESFTKILGDIKGLTVLYSPYGDKVIYSQSEGGGLTTKIYDIEEGSSSDFSYKTLPEKCLFSPANEDLIYCAVPAEITYGYYPDVWYKGLVQFEDTLWKINTADGSTEKILEGGEFDMINLFSNSTGDFIFFQNKKDGTLWSLQIDQG